MNPTEARQKINIVKNKLEEMREISSYIKIGMFDEDPVTGYPFMEPGENMAEEQPERNKNLHDCWEDIQKTVPSGFSIDGSLVRHLSFNEAHDWLDISARDIPRELVKINEYDRKLSLIEYIETLRPEVRRVSETILSGDIDAALKTVFTSLDAKIRSRINCQSGNNTVPSLGKAFKEGKLMAHDPSYNEAARNFLQGVLGFYRNFIIHNELPQARMTLDASLSLFAIAHEAFELLDNCSKQQDPFFE
jgi:hypothetical protein